MTEYTNSTGGSACNYNTLCNYNSGGDMAPMPKNINQTRGKYVVPTYSAPTYDALTHGGVGSCSGYFNIKGAYGDGAGKCNQSYVTSICNKDGCGSGKKM